MTVTYTAGATGWGNGMLQIEIPAGWSAPSLIGADPGYFSVSVSGGVYAGKSKSGQFIRVYVNNLTAVTGTIAVTYGDMSSGGPGATAQPGGGAVQFKVYSDPFGTNVAEIAAHPEVTMTVPKGRGAAEQRSVPVSDSERV